MSCHSNRITLCNSIQRRSSGRFFQKIEFQIHHKPQDFAIDQMNEAVASQEMTAIISTLRDRFTQLVGSRRKKSRVYGHIVKLARKCSRTKDGKRQINFNNKENVAIFYKIMQIICKSIHFGSVSKIYSAE
jgi:hypothetical protein